MFALEQRLNRSSNLLRPSTRPMSMPGGPCPVCSKWQTGRGHDCIAMRRSIADVDLFVVLRSAHAVEINPFMRSILSASPKLRAPLQADARAPERLRSGTWLGNKAPSLPGNDEADALKDRLPQREKIDARRPYSARPNSASRWRF